MPIVLLVFGAITVKRSVYADSRKTDAGVYFRAAWAVSAGIDPYIIVDDNGWSYTYPPPFAVASLPFSEPPIVQGADGKPATDPRGWSGIPYTPAVIIWYILGCIPLILACEWLARSIALSSPCSEVRNMPRFCRRWWQDRLIPAVICIVGIGSTLGRGQSNTMLLLCIVGLIWWSLRGRSFRAGLWIAAAAAIKVFPAFLGLFALLRRDWRMVAGCFVGGFLFLAVLPACVVGPARAWELNRRFLQVMILPNATDFAGTGSGEHDAKVKEFQRVRDNQSIAVIVHAALNLSDVKRLSDMENKEVESDPIAKIAHAVIGGGMVLLSIFAWWRLHRQKNPWETLLTVGMLTCVMMAISPVCHLHYFMLGIPLVGALWAIWLERGPTGQPGPLMWLFFGIYFALNLIPRFGDGAFEVFRVTRFLGLAQYGNLLLWAAGLWTCVQITGTRAEVPVAARPALA